MKNEANKLLLIFELYLNNNVYQSILWPKIDEIDALGRRLAQPTPCFLLMEGKVRLTDHF